MILDDDAKMACNRNEKFDHLTACVPQIIKSKSKMFVFISFFFLFFLWNKVGQVNGSGNEK